VRVVRALASVEYSRRDQLEALTRCTWSLTRARRTSNPAIFAVVYAITSVDHRAAVHV